MPCFTSFPERENGNIKYYSLDGSVLLGTECHNTILPSSLCLYQKKYSLLKQIYESAFELFNEYVANTSSEDSTTKKNW